MNLDNEILFEEKESEKEIKTEQKYREMQESVNKLSTSLVYQSIILERMLQGDSFKEVYVLDNVAIEIKLKHVKDIKPETTEIINIKSLIKNYEE